MDRAYRFLIEQIELRALCVITVLYACVVHTCCAQLQLSQATNLR